MVPFNMARDEDEDPEERAVFLSGDRRRSTDDHWRLQDYDKDGPLTESQIDNLSDRFGLDREALRHLSSHLGFVLNPNANPHVIPASHKKGKAKAQHDLTFVDMQLQRMQGRLAEVIERLSLLSHQDAISHPNPPRYKAMLLHLQAALEEVLQGHEVLSEVLTSPPAFVKWEPRDPRSLYDRRRREVLVSIFQAWVDAGRSVGCATDPGTPKRSG